MVEACHMNSQFVAHDLSTHNAQHIVHAADFSQWLMTKKNKRRIHSATMK